MGKKFNGLDNVKPSKNKIQKNQKLKEYEDLQNLYNLMVENRYNKKSDFDEYKIYKGGIYGVRNDLNKLRKDLNNSGELSGWDNFKDSFNQSWGHAGNILGSTALNIYNQMFNGDPKEEKFAYGGTPIKMTSPSEAIAQGNINTIKNLNDIENKYAWMDTVANVSSQLGSMVLGGSGVLGQVGNVVNGVSKAQNGEEAIMGVLGNLDIQGLLGKALGGQAPTMAYGGEVPPPPEYARDKNNYYKSLFKYDGIKRPIRVKGYKQGDNMLYYLHQDYDDPNAMPVGQAEMENYVRQMTKNNPGYTFINGDTPQYRKLYNDDKWDLQERYSARIASNDDGIWFTGVKGGDENFFQKRQKSYPNAGQTVDKIQQLKDSKGRNPYDYYTPEAIGRHNFFENLTIQGRENEKYNSELLQKALLETNKNKFSMGGLTSQVPIEAEGQELIETPDGLVSEIMGASHEQGGVDMEVPEGSKIYSKRLKGPDGKTMAQRKEFREKHLAKLEKLLERNPSDKVLKKTYEKTRKDFEKQDAEDMALMQHYNESNNQMQNISNEISQEGMFSTGGKVKNNPTGITPVTTKRPGRFNFSIIDDFTNELLKKNSNQIPLNYNLSNKEDTMSLQRKLGMNPELMDGVYGKRTHEMLQDYLAREHFNSLEKPGLNFPKQGVANIEDAFGNRKTPQLTLGEIVNEGWEKDRYYSDLDGNVHNMPEDSSDNKSSWLKSLKGVGKDLLENNPFTAGDLLSLYGQYRAGTDPLKLTMQQRAGDTPNINPYEDYGLKGIEQMEKTKDFLKYNLNQNLMNNETNANLARNSSNSNARGINTLRAMNLGITHNQDKADNQAFGQYAQQVAGVDQTLSHLFNQRDARVMQGESQRDLADRQDRDNFYTQLQRDTNVKNQMYQQVGKTLNDIKEREFGFNTINQMTRFKVGKDGKLYAKANGVYEPHENTAMERGMTMQQLENLNKGIADGTIEYDKDKKGFFNTETGKELDNDGNVMSGGRTIETTMMKKANSMQKIYQKAYGNQLNLPRELTGMEWQKLIQHASKQDYTPFKLDDGTEIDLSNLEFDKFNGYHMDDLRDDKGKKFTSLQQFQNFIKAGKEPQIYNVKDNYIPFTSNSGKYNSTYKIATGKDSKGKLIEEDIEYNVNQVNKVIESFVENYSNEMRKKNKPTKFDLNSEDTIEWLRDKFQYEGIDKNNAVHFLMGKGELYKQNLKIRNQSKKI